VFGRTKKDRRSDEQPAAEKPAAPERPAPSLTPPIDRNRTTSYPQGTEGPPPRRGEIRTTSYPAPTQRNSRGYDSIN
jgi:hypothetical protein